MSERPPVSARVKDVAFNGLLYLCNHWIASLPSHRLRLFYYRRFMGFSIGRGSSILMGARFLSVRRVKIGTNCVINENCVIGNRGGIELGNYVILAPQVYLHSSAHDVNDSSFSMRYGKVTIEDHAFIGLRATVLKGVTVRKGGVVAAGALVTHDVGEFEIWAGVPARKIGDRNRDVRELPAWAPLFH